MSVLLAIAVFILTALTIRLYSKYTTALCTSTKKLEGRTCLVTGGTAGIGLEIAKELARRNARVIIACPFPEEGRNAEKIIKDETRNENVVFKHLDLANLSNVRRFAEDVLKTEDRLDILINNAGVGWARKGLTTDGLCFVMQVNYFGHFLLTLLLLPLLNKTGKPTDPSRIVNTCSNAYKCVPFGAKDIQFQKYYRAHRYNLSKLCLIHFTKELSRKLDNFNVVVNGIHPGIVATRIYKHPLICYIFKMFKTTFEGAQTSLHAALNTEAGKVSGKYFDNCNVVEVWSWARNSEEAKEVWNKSVELVKIGDWELEKCFEVTPTNAKAML